MEKTTKYIDLSPLGKCRRILVFLADFFIAFILGLALFSLGCYPISKTVPSVKQAQQIEKEGQDEKRNLLFSSNLLSKTEDRKNDDTSSIMEYSSNGRFATAKPVATGGCACRTARTSSRTS